MHTVLRTTAVRLSVAAATAVTLGCLSAPALASTASVTGFGTGQHARLHKDVRIGHAVMYVRWPDGSIHQVRP
jgi:hypothetical protein